MAAAAVAGTAAVTPQGFGRIDARGALVIVAMAGAFAAAEVLAVHLHFGRHAVSYSFSEIPLLIGLAFVAPAAVVIARAAGAVWGLGVRRRQPVQKLAFNLAHRWLETVVAILVWNTLTATAPVTTPLGWLAAAATVLVLEILGSAVVAAVIRIAAAADAGGAGELFWRPLLAGLPAAIANTSVALLIVTVARNDWRSLWMIGVVVALIVVFQRAHGQLQQRHATLERVAAFGQAVASELQTEAVATVTLHELRTQLSARVAGLVFSNEFANEDAPVWDCVDDAAPPRGDVLDILCRVESPVVIERTTKSVYERSLLESLGLRDALVVPLRHGEGAIGTLVVGDRIGDAATFDAEDLQVCTALASNAAIALNNGRLAAELRSRILDNEHQAMHDALTGLPNRRLFAKRLEEATGPVAVLLFDLDGFKEVNDTLGHHTGDQLLTMVAERLVARMQSARCIARLGGDEFAIAVDVDSADEAVAIGRTLRAAIGAQFSLADMALTVDASVGVATAKTPSETRVLLQHADVAMYQAKNARTGVELYAPEKDPSSHDRLLLPGELRHAIDAGQLVVYYQPKVTLETDAVSGVEALVRWNHPRRGLVPPAEFIPLAEQAGLINALTQFVLIEALTQCRRWRDAGHDLSVAVNVAPRTLHDEDFPETLSVILAQTGCPATALTLEITESDIMAEPARTIDVLQRLAAMGVQLAVDDLGTGYSSLSYLRRLPVHEVKIDRSFVMHMAQDTDDEAIIEAIVALGHRLGKRIVAEGVEDEISYHRLRELGCTVAQGYWLSRPVPPDELTQWLAAWPSRFIAMELADA